MISIALLAAFCCSACSRPARLVSTSCGLSRKACGHAAQHVDEARPAVARGIGEVGAAPERLARRRAEHGERPAALLAQDLQRLHVDGVDVGPLLAVDLDVDEQLVHHRRHFRRFEALVRHDMAPVAGGVADREQDRPVGALGLGQRLLAPRPPVHGIVGVLQQVGAGLGARGGSCRLLSEVAFAVDQQNAASAGRVSAP